MGRVSHCFCRCIMLVCGGPCDSLVNVHAFSRTFICSMLFFFYTSQRI